MTNAIFEPVCDLKAGPAASTKTASSAIKLVKRRDVAGFQRIELGTFAADHLFTQGGFLCMLSFR